MTDYMSFRLPDDAIEEYASRPVSWGFPDAAGNGLGEVTYIRTYSRLKEDGKRERWHETCRRVVEGMYSIQKDWCKENRLPWNERQARHSALECYERLFSFKWTPPGRGLWMMGTPLVMEGRNSAALQNCSFISTGDMTKRHPAEPFAFMMEALMLGVGVGFDTLGAQKEFTLYDPLRNAGADSYRIPDTREGWVEATKLILETYLLPDRKPVNISYDLVRPEGAQIKTFGGTASGPGPLIELHEKLRMILSNRHGQRLTSTDIVDIGNLIGKCVVSGNVRRSAELAVGLADDKDFLALKDYERNAHRSEWGWMSNNSINAHVGMDYTPFVEGITRNGEPGLIWMDISRKYGRLADPANDRDYRAMGYNPCAEQTLESYECCTLVENFLSRHKDLADFKRTLKFSYMYAKTVTMIPTHWPETNAVMQRNRRIGCSVSGQAAFADTRGWATLKNWLDAGYSEVQRWDHIYSEWLGIRESIKTTSVKPSGTVSLVAGETPGVHWPAAGEFINRAVRFSNTDPILQILRTAGYRMEVAIDNPTTTSVVYFPVRSVPVRSDREVSVFEKAALAAAAQRHWADNSVSVTLSFDRERESKHIAALLAMYEGQFKTLSFLPQGNDVYPQMPYTDISADDYADAGRTIRRMDLREFYDSSSDFGPEGEKYCTTDHCEVPIRDKSGH